MLPSLLRKLFSCFFSSLKRTLLSLCTLTTLSLASILIIVSWIAVTHLLSPSRRALQDYHKATLQAPLQHGLQISHFTAASNTPCLIVTAVPNAPSNKAKLMLSEFEMPMKLSSKPHGNVILMHGRNGRKEDLLPVAERFCAVGLRCICIDLPGHGDHPTDITTYGLDEAKLIKEVYTDIKHHFAIDEDEPEFLWGYSMGGAVAIRAAATDQEWDGLIAISTFTSLPELIEIELNKRAPLFTTTLLDSITLIAELRSPLRTEQINSEALIRSIKIPTLIVHGDSDFVIPLSHGRRLFEAAGTPSKQFITVPGGAHPNTLATGGSKLYAKMGAFMLERAEQSLRK